MIIFVLFFFLFLIQGELTTNCQQSNINGTCIYCNNGYKLENGICLECSEGYYSQNGISCNQCIGRFFSNEKASTECIFCSEIDNINLKNTDCLGCPQHCEECSTQIFD